jgi:hypothetical protein
MIDLLVLQQRNCLRLDDARIKRHLGSVGRDDEQQEVAVYILKTLDDKLVTCIRDNAKYASVRQTTGNTTTTRH